MARGKKSSGKNYTSKGEVGVNTALSKELKRARNSIDNALNAFKAWEKGMPTPKYIQKFLGVSAATSHRDWIRRNIPKTKEVDA